MLEPALRIAKPNQICALTPEAELRKSKPGMARSAADGPAVDGGVRKLRRVAGMRR